MAFPPCKMAPKSISGRRLSAGPKVGFGDFQLGKREGWQVPGKDGPHPQWTSHAGMQTCWLCFPSPIHSYFDTFLSIGRSKKSLAPRPKKVGTRSRLAISKLLSFLVRTK